MKIRVIEKLVNKNAAFTIALSVSVHAKKPKSVMKMNQNESHLTNNTFGFCQHAKSRPEKTKRVISCQPTRIVLLLNFRNER